MSFRSGFTGSSSDVPPSAKFSEASKRLAKSYYPYIYVDKRRMSKPVVDLQAALEVCADSLDEFEKVAAEIESLRFAMYGLEQALSRAVTELLVIREEVTDLMASLKDTEKFNLRLFDQLLSLDKCMQAGIESAQSSLSKAKSGHTTQASSIDRYRIPKSTKETLEAALGAPTPTMKGSSDISYVMGGTPSEQERPEWITKLQRELSHRHAEFSFLVIGLWTEGIYDNHELVANEPTGCFKKPKSVDGMVANDARGLLYANKGKIEDAPATLSIIATKVQDIGTRIFEELGRVKKELEDTKTRHHDLTVELANRRKQLVESLLATHSAVQTLLDMDEANDALVGKLIKTRPLFAELHQALINGDLNSETDISESKYQLLPEVLGKDGWAQLLDSLGAVRLPHNLNGSNQNAALGPSEQHLGLLDSPDTFSESPLISTKRRLFRRRIR
ncbi:unnamed protein product [Schistocephalus solidus]|uniref:Exocyst complex component Sec8 n=1 Tax=Schistocephalus solidus TaxID=70667 RepID=A0A0X3P8P2_SCHSO|nr:unnamed protein product [Schistocephalus solidus]